MTNGTCAGVDWAKDEHAVCLVDEAGCPLWQRQFAHDEQGLGALRRLLVRHGVQRVAIERPEGVLVERLLAAGLVVLAVHPNQMKAARPRFRAAGGNSDGKIFLSLFRGAKPTVTAARLVAGIGDCRARYPTAEAMASDAGMSPVAAESGRRKVAAFRRACDKRLRDAVAILADSTRHYHPWAREVYRRARARGCDHPHAVRILGRAWVRVIWRMWQDGTTYDPAQHGSLQRLKSAGG